MSRRKRARSVDLNASFDRCVEEIKDEQQKATAKCMHVLISALEVGANVDRLTKKTGYPRDFIESISQRMHQAGPWIGEWVDDLEWQAPDDVRKFEFYLQSQVALGTVLREQGADGRCRYINATTNKKAITDWSPRDERALARTLVRSKLK